MTAFKVEPFSVSVSEDILSDLRTRIHNTRWPNQIPGIAWDQGTELGYLRQLLNCWANEFDWRAQERDLNTFDHFHADIDGIRIHFVHAKARYGNGLCH